MSNYTEPEFVQWSVKELATPYYGKVQEDSAKALTLPKYQRNFVWSDKKRKELIDSLRRGFPIGTLIVRRVNTLTPIERLDGKTINAETFELLDGLQRSTTLLLNRLNFLELIDEDDVSEVFETMNFDVEALQELLEVAKTEYKTKLNLCERIAEWMRGCNKVETTTFGSERQTTFSVKVFDRKKFQTLGLYEHLSSSYGIPFAKLQQTVLENGFDDSLMAFPEEVSSKFEIKNKQIPVIIWEGTNVGAASIFERVNQGGVKLNRYQSLAATWYNTKTDLSGSSDVGKLANAALFTKTAGAVVEKHLRGSESLDLYETLVGISEKLARDFPYLFKPAEKPKTASNESSPLEKLGVNYYAFNIAAISLGVKITDLAQIQDYLEVSEDGILEVKQLCDAIYKSASKVNEALTRLSYANSDNSVGHSEAAMTALVAALCASLLIGKTLGTISLHVLRQHYLLDLIAGLNAKGHATDLAAFERVWIVDGVTLKPNTHYLEPVDQNLLVASLDEYWAREKQRTISFDQKLRPRIDNVQKTLLRLYLGQQAQYEIAISSKSHHVDHVIPFQKGLEWLNQEAGSTFYIGALTNLAFLPSRINLSKGKNTLDEWLEKKLDAKEKPVREEVLKNFTKEQIWSLVAANPKESENIGNVLNRKNLEQEFNEMQENIWMRMKLVLLQD
jgi:hypothetical protein